MQAATSDGDRYHICKNWPSSSVCRSIGFINSKIARACTDGPFVYTKFKVGDRNVAQHAIDRRPIGQRGSELNR